MSVYSKIYTALVHLHEVIKMLDGNVNSANLQEAISMIVDSKRIFTFGNGGSHSTAEHFSNDLIKQARKHVICVSGMNAAMLAYMNDTGVDLMFENIVRRFEPTTEDLIIAFSCSGNSINVTQVLRSYPTIPSILFTGTSGGASKKFAHVTITVPHPSIFVQESVHSVLCHAIIEELRA